MIDTPSRGVPRVMMMWTPKEAGGLGAAFRPPMGPGRSLGGGPGAKPRKLADFRHLGCKFPALQDAFSSIFFLVILCCPAVISCVNKIRIMGWKSSNLIG